MQATYYVKGKNGTKSLSLTEKKEMQYRHQFLYAKFGIFIDKCSIIRNILYSTYSDLGLSFYAVPANSSLI